MAQFLMSEFLATVVPDYTAVTINIAPHDQMTTNPVKTQKLKYKDDNTPLVLNINNATKFKITLQWDKLSLADAETIMELWTSTSKADGMANSIVWTNPADSKTYTVHFITEPLLRHFPILTQQSIDQVKLLVIGNYVP
jgi:hypothetical protein